MENINKKTILIAPLDWGLGHTTRCIPIIKTLQSQNYSVIVAATPQQQAILQQEFTNLQYINLFGYNITYTKNARWLIVKILLQIPKIIFSIYKEHKWLKRILQQQKIDIVISDNRYGLYNATTPCIFITHQLQIQTGNIFLNKWIQKINYYFIDKYKKCWIPDVDTTNNIAGELSKPKKMPSIPTHYIGALNRWKKNENNNAIYDVCIMLSGVEPQRTILENTIINQLKNISNKKIILLRGLPNATSTLIVNNVEVHNHLQRKELEQTINNSQLIIARSGYTTIMEILALQKRLIAIPTPQQTEQEYLAQYLHSKKYVLSYNQSSINLQQALQQAETFDFVTLNNIRYYENVVLNDCKNL